MTTKRTFEIMPRDPNAKGLDFQSSIYEPISGGHNLICEVYLAKEAEYIKACLNAHEDERLDHHEAIIRGDDLFNIAAELLEAAEAARAALRTIDSANPGGYLVGAVLLVLDKAIAKARSE